jgi:hypothetical protein
MFCIFCGTQLPDGAGFCSKCGKPQQQGIQNNIPAQLEPTWEVCEIMFDKRNAGIGGQVYWFYAEVLGSKGLSTIGKTEELHVGSHYFDFPKSSDRMAIDIHTKLVNNLLTEGWEPVTERGISWWSYRFRRRVGLITRRICEITLHTIKMQLIPTILEAKFEAVLLGFENTVIMESPIMIFKSFKEGVMREQNKSSPEVLRVHADLVNRIIQAGWDLEKENGKYWYNKRFIERP